MRRDGVRRSDRRGGRVAGVVVTIALLAASMGSALGHDCDCDDTECTFTCSESDLRAAVALLTECEEQVPRTLRFDGSECASCVESQCQGYSFCTMPVRLVDSLGACGNDAIGKKSICLDGNNLSIVGADIQGPGVGAFLVAVYERHCSEDVNKPCASDADCTQQCLFPCGPAEDGPRLFKLRGTGNGVASVYVRYVPKAIQIEGNQNGVHDVYIEKMCEDGISVASGGGHTIKARIFGHQPPDAGYVCLNGNGVNASMCGMDKGIQVNDATSGGADDPIVVRNSFFTHVKAPLRLCENCSGSSTANSVIFEDNTIRGRPPSCPQYPNSCSSNPYGGISCRNVCQGVEIDSNVRPAIVRRNHFEYCKAAVRVMGAGKVIAEDNKMFYGYEAGIRMEGNGARARLSGNKLKQNGCDANATCRVGGIVAVDTANAWVDAGGGDFLGNPVLCSGGGCSNPSCTCGVNCPADHCSPGGNISCQLPHYDIWNNPIADSACPGGLATTGASIGFRNNDVHGSWLSPPPAVKNASTPRTALSGLTFIASCPF